MEQDKKRGMPLYPPLATAEEVYRNLKNPLRVTIDVDEGDNYTVRNAETGAVLQIGWMAGSAKLPVRERNAAVLANLREASQVALAGEELRKYYNLLQRDAGKPELSVSAVVIPHEKSPEGVLISSVSYVWSEIVDAVSADWSLVSEFSPEAWEEIVAGAYKKAGYDEVTLTPRSRDHGRDVIAVKRGIGSVRILGSVKAYKPGHRVGYDHVRAAIGVLFTDPKASKAIITTTSDFPPRIADDPQIASLLPTRLELMNGDILRKWLMDLRGKKLPSN